MVNNRLPNSSIPCETDSTIDSFAFFVSVPIDSCILSKETCNDCKSRSMESSFESTAVDGGDSIEASIEFIEAFGFWAFDFAGS